MVHLISKNFKRFYYAPVSSFAGLICIGLYVVSIVTALLLAYSNEGKCS